MNDLLDFSGIPRLHDMLNQSISQKLFPYFGCSGNSVTVRRKCQYRERPFCRHCKWMPTKCTGSAGNSNSSDWITNWISFNKFFFFFFSVLFGFFFFCYVEYIAAVGIQLNFTLYWQSLRDITEKSPKIQLINK